MERRSDRAARGLGLGSGVVAGAVFYVGTLVLIAVQEGVRRGPALLSALAFTALGGLCGFLFGVPRTQQSDAPPGPDAAGYRLRVNTNLEQISDWLTKILVGITLVQLGQLPGLLQRLSAYLALGMGQGAPGAEVTALVIVLYALVVGFSFAYLATRLLLSQAFKHADESLLQVEVGARALGLQHAEERKALLLEDLQVQALALRRRATADGAALVLPAAVAGAPKRQVLWVDDHPSNNAYEVKFLAALGVQVEQVVSTEAALQRLGAARFAAVVSDLRRVEAGVEQAQAGVALLHQVRAQAPDLPFLFYTSREPSADPGASAVPVLRSPTVLFETLLGTLGLFP